MYPKPPKGLHPFVSLQCVFWILTLIADTQIKSVTKPELQDAVKHYRFLAQHSTLLLHCCQQQDATLHS